MRRKVAIAAVVALVGLAALLWWLLTSLDAVVARQIERAGQSALGVPVRVGSVDLELREGRGTVRRLRVANPEGFSSEPALEVEEIVLELRPAALRERPRGVERVLVRGPVARFEVDEEGRANLDVLRRHAAHASEAAPGEAPAGEAEPERLVLHRLVAEEGRVVADLRAVGGERRELLLPPLRMREVGGAEGAPPSALAGAVARRLLANVAAAVAAERLGTFLEQKVDEGGEAAKRALRSLLGREPPEETE